MVWDSRGIILNYYLQKVKKINGAYYGNLLQRLINEIMKKGPYMAKIEVLFHYDNSLVYSSIIAMGQKLLR